MTYLPKKRCFPYSFNANDQNMLPLCVENQEIFEQRLPAEECKALVHQQSKRKSLPFCLNGWWQLYYGAPSIDVVKEA